MSSPFFCADTNQPLSYTAATRSLSNKPRGIPRPTVSKRSRPSGMQVLRDLPAFPATLSPRETCVARGEFSGTRYAPICRITTSALRKGMILNGLLLEFHLHCDACLPMVSGTTQIQSEQIRTAAPIIVLPLFSSAVW